MASKGILMTLSEVMIANNGSRNRKRGEHLLNFVLVYPREGVSAVSTVKSVSLKSAAPKKFKGDKFQEIVIFKQRINGRCGLLVEISAVDKATKLEKAVQSIFKEVGERGLSVLTGGIANVLIGKVADTAGEALLSNLPEGEDTVNVIGTAHYTLQPNELPTVLRLPLIVERDVLYTEWEKGKRRPLERDRKRRVLVPKGENGFIEVNITEL